MNTKITIGSRGSKLALIYAQIAKDKIIHNTNLKEEDILIKKITTKGDEIKDFIKRNYLESRNDKNLSFIPYGDKTKYSFYYKFFTWSMRRDFREI